MTEIETQYYNLRLELTARIKNIRKAMTEGYSHNRPALIDHELAMLEFSLDYAHKAIDEDIERMCKNMGSK